MSFKHVCLGLCRIVGGLLSKLMVQLNWTHLIRAAYRYEASSHVSTYSTFQMSEKMYNLKSHSCYSCHRTLVHTWCAALVVQGGSQSWYFIVSQYTCTQLNINWMISVRLYCDCTKNKMASMIMVQVVRSNIMMFYLCILFTRSVSVTTERRRPVQSICL